VSTSALAYGYVRLSRADSRRLEQQRRQIAAYCDREGLALELVFADAGAADTEPVRPGWIALLDVLALSRAEAVVVLPTLEHLSRDPVLRAEMRTCINASGARAAIMPAAAEARARQRDAQE
jgi:DNA invertase Pin-like site-specific DNA recombinase